MSLRVESSDQDERLWAHLHGAGLNFTQNRRTVLAVFLAGTEPVTITDLWLRAKKADHRTSHSTVWRLLRALCECGLAKALKRIFLKMRKQNFNCLEVTKMVENRFLGVPYITVFTHPITFPFWAVRMKAAY